MSQWIKCTEPVELVPKRLYTRGAQPSFELPILHNTWGKDHPGSGDYGFLPNVLDTRSSQLCRREQVHRA